jgi:hypothetical protein
MTLSSQKYVTYFRGKCYFFVAQEMTAYGKAGTIAEEALSAIRLVHYYMSRIMFTVMYTVYDFVLNQFAGSGLLSVLLHRCLEKNHCNIIIKFKFLAVIL